MARKRRRARSAAGAQPRGRTQQAPAPETPLRPQWRWRTFPVFFAFVGGVLVASLINPPGSTIGYVVQLAAIAGFGYGLAHLFVMNVIVAGRLKRRRAAARHGEEPAASFEEELVYPNGDSAPSDE